ncbi:PTS system cellobiose-specific IIB component [Microbacterium proteolyticum]|uniref:PTS system cellobiose-specific IIB component n=1 Tax=Microbacterium proteolyticum TaxID=1572644 RepID=A0A7W5GE99_9MICO|nr:PTS sugar transporter [Microbacterium proteolyticum]MBB3156791.1 PTS system cellobiose-specific IIB component [Microbacterium proteolyticum]
MRILVVCGAGASSTFVAQRVRRAAHECGLDHTASASTARSLPIDIDSADIVLVGPHLAAEIDRIRDAAAARSVAVVLLPDDVFADVTGTRTLALVEEALRVRQPADTI